MPRLYRYIGSESIRARVAGLPAGTRIDTASDLAAWIRQASRETTDDDLFASTFVVRADGSLFLADRRSEHVACAGGEPVLSAGEAFFRLARGGVEVVEISNQSTGYCPEPESWPAAAAALDRLGVRHPGGFTTEFIFRRCEKCSQRNVVKEGCFVCAVCGADLPTKWNF